MAGHVLTQALDEGLAVTTIPSWDDAQGEDGSHDAAQKVDPWAEEEAMRQLVALGYVDAGDDDAAGRAARATREANLNLARVFRSTGRNEEALPLLQSISRDEPENDRYRAWLMQGLLETRRLSEARKELETLRRSEKADKAALSMMEGHLLLAERKPAEALAVFDSLAEEAGSRVNFGVPVGEAYLRLGEWNDAVAAFSGALMMDVDNPRALHGLAVAHIGLRDYRAAVDYALATVGHVYHFPEAHFHLGVAMIRLGWADRAEQAFLVALSQRPSFPHAHRWLARIYGDYLRNPVRARHHRNEFDRLSVPAPPPARGTDS
jgi:tetratricopeptide (TPR) repeat protein